MSARPTLTIDESPAGSWRAELARRAGESVVCAACRQSTCNHTDAEYQGLVPELRGRNGDRS